MKLLVPCNWDINLIEATKSLPVYDFYGSTQYSPIGHGRPALIIPNINEDTILEFINKAHSLGRKFSYVLNAPNMANLEFDPKFHRKLLEYFQWLVDIKIDSVHVANPFLMEIIIEQFPQLKVGASVICGVASVEMAQRFEKMGVNYLTLSLEINRDFQALKAIRKAVKMPLIVIPNLADLRQCHYRQYHYSILGYTSQAVTPEKAWRYWAMQPCKMQCNETKISEPVEIIKSCFIRPEDLKFYDEIGINYYKLSGRHQNTEWITRVAKAYSDYESPANLSDIIDTIVLNNQFTQEFHLDFISKSDEEIKAVPEFYSWSAINVDQSDLIKIHSKKLDNFFKFFVDEGCNSSKDCKECGYCEKWVNSAIEINPELANIYLTAIRNHRRALKTSKFAKIVQRVEWEPKIQEIFDRFVINIPSNIRDVVKNAIIAHSESNARDRNSLQVQEQDIARALINNVPTTYRQSVMFYLSSVGINTEKYVS